jgi:hypothetical protein
MKTPDLVVVMHMIKNKLPPLLAVCFFIFHTGVLFAEEVPVKLPPKIEKAVQATKATILKNYQSEIDKLLKELEKSKILATKAGNLNDAIIVDNLIKEISNDRLLAEIRKDNKEKAGTDLLGNGNKKESDENADQKVQIVGKWKRGGTVVELKNNGTFTDSRNINGTWDCNADGSFSMSWSDSGVTVNCSKPDKNFSFENGSSTSKMEKIIK